MKAGDVLSHSDEYYQRFDVDQGIEDVAATVSVIRNIPECKGRVGALGYCLGGKLACLTAVRTDVDCTVSYYGVAIEASLDEADSINCPLVMHFAEEDGFVPPEVVEKIRDTFSDRPETEIYNYLGVDHAFATLGRASYQKPSTMMAYTRSLALLSSVMRPIYNLSQLWDMRCTTNLPRVMCLQLFRQWLTSLCQSSSNDDRRSWQ